MPIQSANVKNCLQPPARGPRTDPSRIGFSRFSGRSRRGMTLLEVMVAASIFTAGALGIYMMLLQANRYAALNRYRDDARAVVQSFADQFERLETAGKVDDTEYLRWLFKPGINTGKGLVWKDSTTGGYKICDETINHSASTPDSGLIVTIGGSSNGIPATVTRTVLPMNSSTGETLPVSASSSSYFTAAGYILQGTFTITYKVGGSDYSQNLTVVRTVHEHALPSFPVNPAPSLEPRLHHRRSSHRVVRRCLGHLGDHGPRRHHRPHDDQDRDGR